MKEIAVLGMLLVMAVATMANGGQVTIYRFQTPTGWIEETNSTVASATAADEWTTQDDPNHVTYDGIPYFPLGNGYYNLPRIEWEVNVSQWIYIGIEYLNFEMHVDMPGDYMVDDLQIRLRTNGGVNIYFETRGNLRSSAGNTIPTWVGYVDTNNGVSIPELGQGNSQFSWVKMNDVPAKNDFLTILSPCGTIQRCGLGEKRYQIWFGFRVDSKTRKGDYSTYLDIFIQSDP